MLALATLGVSPARAQQSAKGIITLTSQSAWVQRSSIPTRLQVNVRSGIAESDLLVSVALYTEPGGSALASRDEFGSTLKGALAGLSQLSLSTFSLASVRKNGGSIDLYVGGSGLPGRVPSKAPSNEVFHLPCAQGCDGVYPLQVSLVDTANGQSVDSFTTYLVVVPSSISSQRRLRFSFVVPLGTSLALSTDGASAVSSRAASAVATVADAEVKWPDAPLSVDLYGQMLLALERDQRYAGLSAALTSRGLDKIVTGTFSNINPTELSRVGLGKEVASQLERSEQIFAKVLYDTNLSHIYVATTPVGKRGLKALTSAGITKVVLPESNLASSPAGRPSVAQWPYTLSAPFRISGSSLEGLQADAGLAAHLSGTTSAALGAQQLLADLAELYFDAPESPSSRGVVLVAPSSWVPESKFLDAALRGLSSSPIITTVPIAGLFESVHLGSCLYPPSVVTGCSSALRAITNPPSSTSSTLTSGSLQVARAQLAQLASVIPTDAALIRNLGDTILLAESTNISAKTRQGYLSAPDATMSTLGSQLSLPAGRTVTVTSSSARFPIDITSSSATPIHAILVVSGSDLSSPATTSVVLQHGTNSLIIAVHTRTSGDSSVELKLLSPDGRLELTQAQLTIRSTAFSGVAIALTVGAAAFLLFWWIRSAGRRRRQRRLTHKLSRTHHTAGGDDPPGASA
jgi:hypothetical protein